MCYRQFLVSDTFILVSSSSARVRACLRACVRTYDDDDDDGDEIILGIIALVAVKSEW